MYLIDMSDEERYNEYKRRCTEREKEINQAIEDENGNLNDEILWHEKCIRELKPKIIVRESRVRQRYERESEDKRRILRKVLKREEIVEFNAVQLEMLLDIVWEVKSRGVK